MYRDDSNENKRSKLCIVAVGISQGEGEGRREKGEKRRIPSVRAIYPLPHRQAATTDTNFAFKGNQARRGRASRIETTTLPTEQPEMEQASRREGDRGTWSSHGTQEKWRMQEAQGN